MDGNLSNTEKEEFYKIVSNINVMKHIGTK